MEVARARRWRCAWLYKLRACLAAEAWLPVGGNASNCRAVAPPDEAGELGWQGVSVGNMSRQKVHEMLERWLCWH